ncbi:unnamed protein product [Polarella glacialis]|uniref:Uncharacterized protein n=1 Tax=Polarella glacialis TaxID=89957 RepID=A0A813LF37_POLGL|nr:unnamed protein product [Polarella glacialis]
MNNANKHNTQHKVTTTNKSWCQCNDQRLGGPGDSGPAALRWRIRIADAVIRAEEVVAKAKEVRLGFDLNATDAELELARCEMQRLQERLWPRQSFEDPEPVPSSDAGIQIALWRGWKS